jgi:uncharacterized protein (DUF1800 family)
MRAHRLLTVLACLLLPCLVQAQSGGNTLFSAGFDGPPEGPYSDREAARFLTQATYGPTLAEITRLRSIGYNAWLTEQFAATQTLHLPLIDQRIAQQGVDNVWQGERHEEWVRVAMLSNDQLRQRVAFALSQILVISDQNGALEGNPNTLANYYDILVRNAFGNYRTLLQEVTLHPAMGMYLSAFKNRKSNQIGTIRPDENYAREIKQLFSVGLVMLNPDGTPIDGDPVAAGVQTVPAYDQDTIRGFAAVFSGWNLSTCRPSLPSWNTNTDTPTTINEYSNWWEWEYCPSDPTIDDGNPNNDVNWKLAQGYRTPMVAWNSYHQSVGAKQLLRYTGAARGRVDANGVLASGGTAVQNLGEALDNIFNHPNVGPFLARLLIQRLVTSNPTPGYVQRVAAVFADDNGAAAGGTRGNLREVVRAILMDSEARYPMTGACTGPATGCIGKVREPLLRLTQLFRALSAQPTHPSGYWTEGYVEGWLGQAAMKSPTVFNFYLPSYALPGPEVAGRGLVSPEFQITVDTYITRISSEFGGKIMWTWAGNPGLPTSGGWRPVVVSLDRDATIAHLPADLVDRYDLLFTGGRMSAPVRQAIVNHVTNVTFEPWRPEAETRRIRVQDALWLTLVSPDHVVEK